MELEKTTVMSAVILVAGTLSEIVFHEALSRSISGIVLGIIIAVIAVIAAYFMLDGIKTILSDRINEAVASQTGHQDKMFKVINSRLEEQIKLEQSIYGKLEDLAVISRSYMEKAAESMFGSPDEAVEEYTAGVDAETLQKILEERAAMDAMAFQKAVDEINSSIINSARAVVKYQMKDTKAIQQTIAGLQKTKENQKGGSAGS